MHKHNLDSGWEYTEATGFAALFNPHAWQPVGRQPAATLDLQTR